MKAGIVAVALLLLVVAWFLVVRPVGAWFDVRTEAAELEATLAQVEQSNKNLEARRDALFTAEEIERLARRDYNLVLPFEEAYAVLPPPARDASWYHRWPY